MDFHQGVLTRLLQDAGVSAIVGQKVNWVNRPQKDALPAITLQVVSDPRPQNLKGDDGARWTRMQIDCWADTYLAAIGAAKAAIAVLAQPVTLNGKKFGNSIVQSQRDLGESFRSGVGEGAGQTFIHRRSVDLLIRHVGD